MIKKKRKPAKYKMKKVVMKATSPIAQKELPKRKYRKNVPTLVIDETFLEEYKENNSDPVKNNKSGLTLTQKKDRDYLMAMFEGLKMQLEHKVVPKWPKEVRKIYRYTPPEMYANIMLYFRVTIEQGQPLTITGMGMFCGIHRKEVFDIKNSQSKYKSKAYAFLKDCADFVEMYNEYAIHKKQNPAGPIFALKNFGWKDRVEVDHISTQGALTEEQRREAAKKLNSFSE